MKAWRRIEADRLHPWIRSNRDADHYLHRRGLSTIALLVAPDPDLMREFARQHRIDWMSLLGACDLIAGRIRRGEPDRPPTDAELFERTMGRSRTITTETHR